MTLYEHQKCKTRWLKIARDAVRKRDWERASSFYKSAAFHSAVIKHLKTRGAKLKR